MNELAFAGTLWRPPFVGQLDRADAVRGDAGGHLHERGADEERPVPLTLGPSAEASVDEHDVRRGAAAA